MGMSCTMAAEGGPVDREGGQAREYPFPITCPSGPRDEPRQVCLAV